MQAKPVQGCFVATLTPFDSADRLDEGVVRAHTQWLVEQGVEGVCPVGTTGEFLYLSQEEKQRLLSATVAAVGGRAPVLAGVWALRRLERAALSRHAKEVGAAGVFLPPPIYYPADDRVVEDYYREVREAADLPVYAYNIPQYAANTVSLECLERLISDGVIAGVKDSTGSDQRVGELVRRFGDRATVFAASDSFATRGRELGAHGFISAIANLMPSIFVRLWQGDGALQSQVDRVRTALKQVGSIPALKHLMSTRGFVFGASRLPYSDLTPQQQAELDLLGKSWDE